MSEGSQHTVLREPAQPVYVSTGIGGAGNMRPPSRSRGEPSNGLFNDTEDDSQIRGREFFASIRAKRGFLGLGGSGTGNAHSSSRVPPIETRNALKEEAKQAREHANNRIPVSRGRGGAGNFAILGSRSGSGGRRERSYSPEVPEDKDISGNFDETEVIASWGRGSEEGTSQSRRQNRSSGVIKVVDMFRRNSHSASGSSPELPETL